MKEVATIGIDLAKTVFQIHGADAKGRPVFSRRLRRTQVLSFFANLPPCLIGLEACSGAHYWARELLALGHDVRLMPPHYVKPYVKRNKTDAADAEAIAEAVTRPTMRFVPVKSPDQQAVLILHRARDLLVRQRTQLVNALRAHLAEFGQVIPQGIQNARKLMTLVAEAEDNSLPDVARDVLTALVEQLRETMARIEILEKRLERWHRSNEVSKRLATIPGIGPITATALIATVGDPAHFKSGRQFAAWIGLTPRERSSGGKQKLGRITRRGDAYLRRLLVHGSRAVVRWRRRKPRDSDPWLNKLMERRHANVATVAQANRTARIAWAVMTREEVYRPRTVA